MAEPLGLFALLVLMSLMRGDDSSRVRELETENDELRKSFETIDRRLKLLEQKNLAAHRAARLQREKHMGIRSFPHKGSAEYLLADALATIGGIRESVSAMLGASPEG